jgi:hypothetical protein
VPTSGLYTGPAEMEPYVQSFIDDGAAQGVDVLPSFTHRPPLTIQVSSLSSYGSSVIGLCETSGSMRRVTFSPTFWSSVDETQRMLVVHHELGHCILYREHRTDLLPSGADASIMYPVIFSDATFNGNSAYYLNELYTYDVSLAANSSAVSARGIPVVPSPDDENSSRVHICNLEEALR